MKGFPILSVVPLRMGERKEPEGLWLVGGLALLPLLLYAGSLYWLVRRFARRVCHYQLTLVSGAVLITVPAASCLAFVFFSPLPRLALVFLLPLVALTEVLVVVEVWAYAKVRPFRKDIAYCHQKVRRYQVELQELFQRSQVLQGRIRALKKQYGQALAQQAELAAILDMFCADQVENRTALLRRWRAEQSVLRPWQLHRLAHRLLTHQSAPEAERLMLAMQAVQARLTALSILLEERMQALQHWEEELEECRREEGELKLKLAQAEKELAQAKETYRRHRTARLRLD